VNTHTPPPTINRPPPRTPSDGSLEGLLLVLCLVWLVGSLLAIFLFSLVLAPPWLRYWRLRNGGEFAAGVIVRHDVGLSWVSYLYRFSPANSPTPTEAALTGQMSLPAGQTELLPANTPVTIRYLPGSPHISAIEPYFRAPPSTSLLYLGFGFGCLLLGVALFPGRWRAWQAVQRWQRDGLVVPAKIIRRWRTVDNRDRDLFCVAYQFEVAGAPVVAAEYNRRAYDTLKIGQTCPVKYLPESPQSCFLVLVY